VRYPNPTQNHFQRASALFHQPNTLPIALTQAYAELNLTQHEGFWLAVTPVQMLADRDTLLMVPGEDLAIEQTESRALFDAFNAHFAQDGVMLHWGGTLSWYLHLPQTVDVQTTPLAEASYRSLQGLFPQGPASSYWRKLMNEAQMLFYGHPVNQARRDQGKAEINSIWIWGEGSLQPTQYLARPQAQVWSDSPYLQGMARLTQADTCPSVANYQTWLMTRNPASQVHFIHQPLSRDQTDEQANELIDAQRAEMVAQWQAQWFAGLLEGLQSGLIGSLYIDLGLKQNFLLTPRDLTRFWRWRHRL
jgi:hypothetical protein